MASPINNMTNMMGSAPRSTPQSAPQSPTGVLSHGQVPGQTGGMASARKSRQGALDLTAKAAAADPGGMIGGMSQFLNKAIDSGALFNLNKTSDLYGGLNRHEAIAQRNLYGAPGDSPREGLGLTYPAGVAGGNSEYSNGGGSDYGNVSTQTSQYNMPSPSTAPSMMNKEAYSNPYESEDTRY